MTIGQLKELIKNVPNDFEFEINISKRKTKEELSKHILYPYPYSFEICKTDKKSYDIGHSEKKFQISIELKAPTDEKKDK